MMNGKMLASLFNTDKQGLETTDDLLSSGFISINPKTQLKEMG